jgi:hypothetical protein
VVCSLTPTQQFFSYIMARTCWFSMIWWWGPLCSSPTCLVGFYSASSLKQQSEDRHVTPLWHISLILSQPVFTLSPYCCVLSGEATNTNFIDFWLEPTIYRTQGEHANHYSTNAVYNDINELIKMWNFACHWERSSICLSLTHLVLPSYHNQHKDSFVSPLSSSYYKYKNIFF